MSNFKKDSTLGDFLEDLSPEEKKKNEIYRKKILLVLKNFSPKDQKIIKMRFGLDDGCGHTLKEVSEKFNVNDKYIRKLESKIFTYWK